MLLRALSHTDTATKRWPYFCTLADTGLRASLDGYFQPPLLLLFFFSSFRCWLWCVCVCVFAQSPLLVRACSQGALDAQFCLVQKAGTLLRRCGWLPPTTTYINVYIFFKPYIRAGIVVVLQRDFSLQSALMCRDRRKTTPGSRIGSVGWVIAKCGITSE